METKQEREDKGYFWNTEIKSLNEEVRNVFWGYIRGLVFGTGSKTFKEVSEETAVSEEGINVAVKWLEGKVKENREVRDKKGEMEKEQKFINEFLEPQKIGAPTLRFGAIVGEISNEISQVQESVETPLASVKSTPESAYIDGLSDKKKFEWFLNEIDEMTGSMDYQRNWDLLESIKQSVVENGGYSSKQEEIVYNIANPRIDRWEEASEEFWEYSSEGMKEASGKYGNEKEIEMEEYN